MMQELLYLLQGEQGLTAFPAWQAAQSRPWQLNVAVPSRAAGLPSWGRTAARSRTRDTAHNNFGTPRQPVRNTHLLPAGRSVGGASVAAASEWGHQLNPISGACFFPCLVARAISDLVQCIYDMRDRVKWCRKSAVPICVPSEGRQRQQTTIILRARQHAIESPDLGFSISKNGHTSLSKQRGETEERLYE